MKRTKVNIAVLVGTVVVITLLLFLVIFNVVIRHQIRSESESAIRQALASDSYITSSKIAYYVEDIVSGGDVTGVITKIVEAVGEDATEETTEADDGGYSATEPDSYEENIADQDEEAFGSVEQIVSQGEQTLYSAESLIIPVDAQAAKRLERYYSAKENRIREWCVEHDTTELTRAEIDGHIYFIQERPTNETIEGLGREAAFVDVTGEYDMVNRVNLIFLFAAIAIGLIGSFAGYQLGKKMEQTQLVQKQFFENTSHELKTPLTAIRGYAEGIQKGVITDYPKTGRVIAAQAEHMSDLVEGILSIAKIESGSIRLKKEEIAVNEFLQDCLMPMEGVIRSRNLEVELDLTEVKVYADPDQLEHAVANLLTNAIKYAVRRIRISNRQNELTIWNDVEEISEEELSHLFDRFYTGKNGNTGIGLALAKDIIGLHGWNISVQRQEEGVAFRVRW